MAQEGMAEPPGSFSVALEGTRGSPARPRASWETTLADNPLQRRRAHHLADLLTSSRVHSRTRSGAGAQAWAPMAPIPLLLTAGQGPGLSSRKLYSLPANTPCPTEVVTATTAGDL